MKMPLAIKVCLFLMLITVTLYCGNIIGSQLMLHFKQNLTSVEVSSIGSLNHEELWGSNRQLNTQNLVQNSTAIHKKLVERHVHLAENTQPTMPSKNISDASGVSVWTNKESRHVPYNTNKTSKRQTDKESEGYILPFSVFEEQTNGAKNLWQLQIWANLVKMHVVEPFAKDSVFTMSGIAPNFSEALRFGDYFDLEKWNAMVMKTHGSPLVKWEEFIVKSRRDAILLYMRKGVFTEPLTIAHNDDVDQYKMAIPKNDLKWIHKNFNIIKRLCYLISNENKPNPLAIEKFNSIIFGDLMPSKVSLIIIGWQGIRPSRIHITPIYMFLPVFLPDNIFPPSKRILKAYKSYITQYVGNRTYVGIVFRSHHVYFYNQYWNKRNFTGMSQTLLQCSKQLKHELDKIRTRHEIFLAIDLGTFGSKVYSTKMAADGLTPLKNQIHLDVFNGSLTSDQREEHLKNAAGGLTDRGFIAQLEKVIATNADCIILLGKRSGFVSTSLSLYLAHHPVNRCVVNICYDDVYRHKLFSPHIPEKFI